MPQARLIPARPWKLVRSRKAQVVVTQEFSLWAIQPQLRFGPSMEFVRLHRQSCQMLLDHIEDDAWWVLRNAKHDWVSFCMCQM